MQGNPAGALLDLMAMVVRGGGVAPAAPLPAYY